MLVWTLLYSLYVVSKLLSVIAECFLCVDYPMANVAYEMPGSTYFHTTLDDGS
jgi:hypothetical protein